MLRNTPNTTAMTTNAITPQGGNKRRRCGTVAGVACAWGTAGMDCACGGGGATFFGAGTGAAEFDCPVGALGRAVAAGLVPIG